MPTQYGYGMDASTVIDQPQDERTLVNQTLQNGFALLRFPNALEHRFDRDLADRRLRLLRLGAAGGIVASLGMLITDCFLLPDVLGWSLWLRAGVAVPFCLLCIWMAPNVEDPSHREWGVALGGIMGVLICLTLILMSNSEWAEPGLIILNVVVIYCVTMGRFWPSAAVSAVAALGHFQALAVIHGPWGGVAIPSTVLLASSIGYSLYCNYRLEYEERLSFLLDLQEHSLQADLLQANDQLARTARTDALTDVANRRHFDEFLAQVWQDAQQHEAPIALMLLDIDHFKAYNDRYGHPAGDRCLHSVAQAVGSCLRKSGDLVARWGGEEFGVVMTGTKLDIAMLAAERVRQAVIDCGIVHIGSTCSSVVTVSVGVSAITPGRYPGLADFVRDVDAALYAAKARGRNQVVTHDPVEHAALSVGAA
jgi:diguanylate cyclase (GGDEF)-like protein